MRLLIGCPVSHREWILERWFEHARAACTQAEIEPAFLLVGDPKRDPATFRIVAHQPDVLGVVTVIDPRGIDRRRWNEERYRRMVELRNALLREVRFHHPEMFLSLDSDILLHPKAISELIKHLIPEGGYDAVGGKCYLSARGKKNPSWAKIGKQGRIQRTDFGGVHKVDVLMAVKLMSPLAYNVDYRYDRQGEDTGWSKACREEGLVLGWTGQVVNKHVMDPTLIDVVDERCGF